MMCFRWDHSVTRDRRTEVMMRTSPVIATIAVLCLLSPLSAQTPRSNPAAQPVASAADVHVLPVKGNVYMLVGAGGNIALQIGDNGVLMVDTGTAQAADHVLAAVKQVRDKPIRWILNTSAD